MLSQSKLVCCPGSSCIYQLLAISHDIFLSFECNPLLETRGVFLDMSKGLGGIGHEGLLFNSNKMILVEISSTNFKHLGITYGVKPNGQISDQETICAVVSHGSIKLPLFLLLTNVLKSNLKLFSDDNCLFLEICHPLETARTLNNDLRKISK